MTKEQTKKMVRMLANKYEESAGHRLDGVLSQVRLDDEDIAQAYRHYELAMGQMLALEDVLIQSGMSPEAEGLEDERKRLELDLFANIQQAEAKMQ